MHIVPAILPKDFSEIVTKLPLVKGVADAVQIDIADGKFAPNKTWPFVGDRGEFDKLCEEKMGFPFWEDFDFEFDLMVAKPQELIADFVRMGASRIIVHLESIAPDALSDLINEWQHSVALGLALKPKTPLERIETFLHEVDFVQCMGNDRIGFQGILLDEAAVLPKISMLRKRHPKLTIGVDIGVSIETAPRLIKAGANRLFAGSAIFGSANPAETLRRMEALFAEST